MEQKELKERAAKAAVDALVRSGMRLGLGTGSTALPAVRYIGKLLQEGTLKDIRAVSTSFQTTIECETLGIPLFGLNSPEIGGRLDLTIDGADQLDPQGNCTKGGGGALLAEKILAYNSTRFALVMDASKITQQLGQTFAIPVEVIPEARLPVTLALQDLGAEVCLREAVRKAGPVITEHANILLDIRFSKSQDPVALEKLLNAIPGVVENGLFTQKAPIAFIAHKDGRIEERTECR